MLSSLHIRNLAVVAELDVEFGSGLNVVTGETGAGKSLILGALQLLLGERASASVIRQGAPSCDLSAVVRTDGAGTRAVRREIDRLLEENSLPAGDDDGALLLRRVISPSGTRNFINGAPVTLQLLGRLGDLLIDIHGPHDHQSLLQPRTQLALLDDFAGLEKELAGCGAAWDALAAARAESARLEAGHLSPQEEEFCRFQLHEIEAAAVNPEEDAQLAQRHAVAAHRRSLLEAANAARQGLTEGEAAAVEQLRAVLRMLGDIESVDAEQGAGFRERLEQLIESAEDLSGDLETYAGSLDLDEAELARLEERLGILQKLKRKYGPELEDIVKTGEALREKLGAVEQRQERLERQAAECRRLETAHLDVCMRLRKARQTATEKLAAAITAKLQKLGFAQGLFAVRLTDGEPGAAGADHAEFCFAPNPGEAMQPLRQIASSGEMARVMLAVKTILSQSDRVPVLIFDEVDANIGGRVAVMVAEEMAAIARRHQVLCISHLPQIAAAGGRHYRVSKLYKDGRTLTAMQLLDDAGREEELTRMLGAEHGSATARDHVREMLARHRL